MIHQTTTPRHPNTLVDIAAIAEELCEPHQHTEQIVDRDPADRRKRRRRIWVTTQPGLISQLKTASEGHGDGRTEQGGSRVPGSRPPGFWEALARHSAISIDVVRWCWELNLDIRDTPEAGIRALVGAATNLDDSTARDLLAALRGWRHQAAVMTGWAHPAFAPAVNCPIVDCGRHATIRINTDRMVAWCIACDSRWDDEAGAIRTLARYIEARTGSSPHRRPRIRSGKQGNGGWLTGQRMAG